MLLAESYLQKRNPNVRSRHCVSRAVACSDSAEQFEVQRVQAMTQEHETVAVDPHITLIVHEDNIKKIQSQTAADPTLIALAIVKK